MTGPLPDASPAPLPTRVELPEDAQTFVVQRLACFDTPTKVAEAVKEIYGIEVNRQSIQYYDPTVGDKPAEKWCTLFAETRKAYIESTAEIGIAHKTFRLDALHRMAQRMEKAGNTVQAAALLKQAAEEMGEVYTNHRTMKVDGQVQGGVLAVPMPMTPAEWAAAAAAQQATLPGAEKGNTA